MSKNPNGTGGICFEKGANRYRAAITSPLGKRIVKRFKTQQEAEQWLTETRADMYKEQFIEPSDITVAEWMLEYLDTYIAPSVRPKTLIRYIQVTNHLEAIGKIKLQRLTAANVQKFYNHADMSANGKLKLHKLLKAAYAKAVTLELVKKNIMDSVATPKYVQEEIQIFTQDEITKLLEYLRDDRYYSRYLPLISLAIATGARLGELLGLKLKSVKQRSIVIDNSLQFVANRLVDMPPKTQAGYREITISPNMAYGLRRLVSDSKVLGIDQYVFHTRSGTPLAPSNVERVWRTILKNASIEPKRFHALRHTHATQLLANGIPIMEVCKRLGHTKPSHTLTLYGHAIKGYDEKIPDQVEKIFFS